MVVTDHVSWDVFRGDGGIISSEETCLEVHIAYLSRFCLICTFDSLVISHKF